MDGSSQLKQHLIDFSILSVSLIIASGNAISPALPSIARAFPKLPISIIDMVGTVQQFAVMLALFVSVAVARKIGIKHTILIGIALVIASGIIPVLFTNFALLMLSRIILGLGIGFFNSLAIDIINIYFKKHEQIRLRMTGIRTSFEPLGQCILNIAAGFLVMINWHFAFMIYFLAIPIFLLFWKYVPDIRETPVKTTNAKAIKKSHPKINGGVFGLAILLMFLVMCNTSVTIEVPNIFSNLHLGSSATSSVVISLNTLAAMGMGFAFSRVYRLIHQYTLPLGLAFIACGCLITSMGRNVSTVTLGAVISGIAFPLSGNYTYALIGRVVSKSSAALAISIVLVGCNLGSFICPLGTSFLGKIGRVFDHSGSSISSAFLMMFLISLLLMLLILGIIIYKQSSLPIKPDSEITKRTGN